MIKTEQNILQTKKIGWCSEHLLYIKITIKWFVITMILTSLLHWKKKTFVHRYKNLYAGHIYLKPVCVHSLNRIAGLYQKYWRSWFLVMHWAFERRPQYDWTCQKINSDYYKTSRVPIVYTQCVTHTKIESKFTK